MRGDVITAVNGCDVIGVRHHDVLQLIEGAGLELTLTIDPQPLQPFSKGEAQERYQQPQQLENQQLQQQQKQSQQPQHRLHSSYIRSSGNENRNRPAELNNNEDDKGSLSEDPSYFDRHKLSDYWTSHTSTELGLDPQPKIHHTGSSKKGFRGTLVEPGWQSRSRPKPVVRSTAYHSTFEMGWTPKARDETKQAQSSSDMGWSPSPVVEKSTTSAFTRVVSNTAGNNGPQTLEPAVYRRQQPTHQHLVSVVHLKHREENSTTCEQQVQESNENPLNMLLEHQNIEKIAEQQQVFQQHEQQQAHGQQTTDNVQESLTQNSIHEQIAVQQKSASHQYHQVIMQENPYLLSDYQPRRAKRRVGYDDDLAEGMPAWYGSLRPAGGRYDRWNTGYRRQLEFEPSTQGSQANQENWVPHGLDRETRMIQAQAAYAATLPYHPSTKIVTNKQTARQQLQQSLKQKQQMKLEEEPSSQQPQKNTWYDSCEPHWSSYPKKSKENNVSSVHNQLVEEDKTLQGTQIDDADQIFNDDPNCGSDNLDLGRQSQRGAGGRKDRKSGNGEKFKSEIQNIHLVTTTWTVPQASRTQRSMEVGQHYVNNVDEDISDVYSANISTGSAVEQGLPRLIRQGQQIMEEMDLQASQVIAKSKVPQQFYKGEALQCQNDYTAAVQQQETAPGHDDASCHRPTQEPNPLTCSTFATVGSAFIDFYVIEQGFMGSETQNELPSSKAMPKAVNVLDSIRQFSGGFIDFYVVSEGAYQKQILNSLQNQTTEFVQTTESASRLVSDSNSQRVANGKTFTGGFLDFYVLAEGTAVAAVRSQQISSGSQTLQQDVAAAGKPAEPELECSDSKLNVQNLSPIRKTDEPKLSLQKKAEAVDGAENMSGVNQSGGSSIQNGKQKTPSSNTEILTSNVLAYPHNDKNVTKENAAVMPNSRLVEAGNNGKLTNSHIKETARLTAEKLSTIQQKMHTANGQKVLAPATFRDQLKPTKVLPGKLK